MQGLEDLGRVRLSQNSYFHDFLYSEIADFYGIPNIPANPELATSTGRKLCEQLLEPLQSTWYEEFPRVRVDGYFRSASGGSTQHSVAADGRTASRRVRS